MCAWLRNLVFPFFLNKSPDVLPSTGRAAWNSAPYRGWQPRLPSGDSWNEFQFLMDTLRPRSKMAIQMLIYIYIYTMQRGMQYWFSLFSFSTLKRANMHQLLLTFALSTFAIEHVRIFGLARASSPALRGLLPAHLPLILLVHHCFGCSAIRLAGTNAMAFRSHRVNRTFCH